jgi:hypothetical protein
MPNPRMVIFYFILQDSRREEMRGASVGLIG